MFNFVTGKGIVFLATFVTTKKEYEKRWVFFIDVLQRN